MSFGTDSQFQLSIVPGILDSLPVTGEVDVEVFKASLVSGILTPGEGLEEQGFDFLPGTLLDSFPEFPSFMRFRACSLDSLRQVEAREDEDGLGNDLQAFLDPGGTITTEEDGFHSVEVIILLQVLEDLEEASVSS
jgi:hypothetical protein